MSKFRMSNKAVLFKFALPQMIAMLFNSIYLIVDGIFIGHRLGPDALAAGGIAVPVVEFVIALALMISVGAGVMISQAFGQNDKEEANRIFNIANIITIVLSISFSVFGIVFVEPISRFLGASNLIIVDTVTYLKYFFLGLPFLVLSFTLSTFVRNDKAPKRAMWALIIGSVSNIILDWLFMYPLNMGMAGAALATALGPAFGVMILLPHFLQKKGDLFFTKMSVPFTFVKDLLKFGTAAFITNFSIGMVALWYNLAIVKYGFGEIGLSSYLIIGYLSLIALRCFLGAAQGVQPVLSLYSSQGDYKRIASLNKFITIFNAVFGIVVTVFILVFAPTLARIFTSDSKLIAESTRIARIYFLNLGFAAINIVIATNLQALNLQKDATLLSLLRSTLPLVVFLIIIPLVVGKEGIWWAVTATEVFTLFFSIKLWSAYQVSLTEKEQKSEELKFKTS